MSKTKQRELSNYDLGKQYAERTVKSILNSSLSVIFTFKDLNTAKNQYKKNRKFKKGFCAGWDFIIKTNKTALMQKGVV
jgi:hypothetical protein